MVPFAAVLLALWRAYAVVARTPALVSSREAGVQIYILGFLDIAIAGLFFWFLVERDVLTRRMSDRLSQALALGAAAIVSIIFIVALGLPFLVADVAPRASVIPVLLGSFIFLATYLAWLGHRYCVPVLALSAVAALTVTSFNVHFNDVRTLATLSGDYPRRQIDIDDAVERWKAVNCNGEVCPPAVIVAAEGGASRAAFAAATAIGELVDKLGHLPDAGGRAIAPARRIFAISGVSGGSFGAATIRSALTDSASRGQGAPPCLRPAIGWFGADALAVRSSWRACLQALVAGDYLTPAFVGLVFRDNLSPPGPFSRGGLFFSDDRAVLVERAWERHYDHVVRGDAPGFVGQAWQDLTVTAEEPASGLRRRFGYLSDASSPEGIWLPLLLLNGTSADSGTRIVTSDLVSTRAAGDPNPNDPNKAQLGRFAIYPEASDTFEILSEPCAQGSVVKHSCIAAHDGKADEPQFRDAPDLRMSTAALLSARFPIISPAANLRAKEDEGDGDRVVDGGYFENAGLTTAMDLAREVRRAGVVPLVLWVQNGPKTDAGDPPSPNGAAPAPLPIPPRGVTVASLGKADPPIWERIFGIVLTPILALTETRDGHGVEAASAAQRELWLLNHDVEPLPTKPGEDPPIGASWFEFAMFENPDFKTDAQAPLTASCQKLAEAWKNGAGAMSEVSMSWWLSQSVQAELDLQVCDARNRKSLSDLMQRLSQRCPLKNCDLSDPGLKAATPSGPDRCVSGG